MKIVSVIGVLVLFGVGVYLLLRGKSSRSGAAGAAGGSQGKPEQK